MNSWWGRLLQGTLLSLLLIAVLAGASGPLDGTPEPTLDFSQAPATNTNTGIEGELRPSPSPTPQPTEGGNDATPWWILAVLGVAGAAAAGYLWRYRRPQPSAMDEPEDTVAEIMTAAIQRLDQGEASDAVTLCWRDLERLAAHRGVLRGAAEPAPDFAHRVASTLQLPAPELAVLGNLFEQAWYSRTGSTPGDIARARSCLQALAKPGKTGRL